MLRRAQMRTLSIVVILLLSFSVQAQYWMQQAGSITNDEGYDISHDNSGNTYTTGYYTGTITFGAFTLNSSGSTDIFIVKTDDQGDYEWAVSAGGSGTDRGLSIKTDAQGNSVITGFFNGSASFSGTTITSAGSQDMFVAQYNNAGALQWVVSGGGAGPDIGAGIDLDNSGNVVVTGEFSGTSTFGGSTITSNNNSTDIFTCKLSSTGTFTWTEQGSGAFTDRGIDVTTDNAGNVYVTGQFSDTITFDQTHNNSSFNAIFVVKYNSNGDEQFFRMIGAATSNFVTGIDGNGSDIWLTGNFTGDLTFFGANNTTITNPYTNRIFVARYTGAGALVFAESSGSDSDISVDGIAVDGSSNSYVIGTFECQLDEYADQYGAGIFISTGGRDIFMAKFSGGGGWQYGRQLGGQSSSDGFGITAPAVDQAHFTGSFSDPLIFPVSANFIASNLANWSQTPCTNNNGYCGDPDYGNFYEMNSAGAIDVVIANCFDDAREPYDFFPRFGTICDRPAEGACIVGACPDTIFACSSATTPTWNNACDNIAPAFSQSWTDAGGAPVGTFPSSGTYFVDFTIAGGCGITTQDSVEVVIFPPPEPLFTDDLGFNTDTTDPIAIEMCHPDSVLITASNVGGLTFTWSGPGLPANYTNASFTTDTGGVYLFNVTDANGCQSVTTVLVLDYDSLGPFELAMNVGDTELVCQGSPLQVQLYDSLSNPTAISMCLDANFTWDLQSNWTITPNPGPFSVSCETFMNFTPPNPGLYTIEAELIRETPCQTDTHYVTRTVFIEQAPSPVIPNVNLSIQAPNYFCPGDDFDMIGSGYPTFTWSGTGVSGDTNDTVTASTAGLYSIAVTLNDTNSFGCTAQETFIATVDVLEKPLPQVNASSLVICPNDSVMLTAVNTGATTGFFWEGPNGPINNNSASIFVTEPGFYFVVINDGDSCGLVSNTVELTQYTTPSIVSTGLQFLCDGDSATIVIVATSGSVIEWQSPLTGDTNVQVVYQPGTYTANITACGIQASASVDVLASYVEADINFAGVLCLDSTLDLLGNSGMETYNWAPFGESTQNINISTPGTYILTTSDSNDCFKSDTVDIVITQEPTAISITGPPVFCVGDSFVLTGNDSMASYLWTPGGGTDSIFVVDQPGNYTLTTVDTNGCIGQAVPIILTNPDTIAQVGIIGQPDFCEGDSVTLFAANPDAVSYSWLPDTSTNDSATFYDSGTFYLTTVDQYGCIAQSGPQTIFVEQNLILDPVITGDSVICAGETVSLSASSNLGGIVWFDEPGGNLLVQGNNFDTPIILENTTFYAEARHSLCASGLIPFEIQAVNCSDIFIPNVFTPDGDGINDLWLMQLEEHTCFSCTVYNRWGQEIYVMDRMEAGWDGTLTSTGLKAVDGTYFYVVDYCKFDGSAHQAKGTVYLLRNQTIR